MKKRAMSLLLVMLMVFALLPAAAFAAVPATESTKDNMNMTKSIQQAADGTYSVTLESWATGQVDVSHQTEKVPTDIILVLDQSGSMEDSMSYYKYTEKSVTLSNLYDSYTSYYVQDTSGVWHEVSCTRSGNSGNRTYTVYYRDDNYDYIVVASGRGNESVTLYTRTSTSTTRLDALKSAVNTFIGNVAAQTNDDGTRVDHRIAIVGFATGDNSYYYDYYDDEYRTTYKNTEIFNGRTETNYSDVTNQTLKSALKAANSTDLTDSVDILEASGATYPQYGLDLALRILSAREGADSERAAAVVLFTDGTPGLNTSANDQYATANKAVEKAKAIKDMGATLFTVGLLTNDSTKLRSGNSSTNYSVKDFMQATSSDYLGNVSLSDSTADKKNPNDTEYYKTTNGSNGLSLEDLFTTIQKTITGETTVDLDASAYLKDVINTDNFVLPENFSASNVSAVTVKGSADEDGNISFETTSDGTIPANQIQVSGNTVKVSGFDYKANYIAYNKPANTTAGTEANQGRKLVVTINGLTPRKAGLNLDSNFEAGVYASNDGEAITIGSPSIDLATKESYVIDFNTKMILGAGFSKLGYKTSNNGQFNLNDGVLIYQLLPAEQLGDRAATLVMNGVDTAMTYTSSSKVWTQHTTIPANNIYFDDALLGTQVAVTDGAGYNVGVTTDASEAVTAIKDGDDLVYTFKGTGIDVYCTTNAAGGYVQAGLMKGDKAAAENLVYFESADGHYYKVGDNYVRIDKDHTPESGATLYDSSLIAVRNYSVTPEGKDRYNVPTVSYTGLPYDTYTIRIKAVDNANYKLDGIRIYNAMANDETVYAGTDEANAHFYNLREALVNDGQNVVVKKQDETSKLDVYLEGQASAALPGVLFIDNKDSVKLEKTVVDAQGNFVLDENGQPKKELVYKDAYSAYVANGPKNEIYLEEGQGIAFTISAPAKGDHYWIGLSAPDQGSTTAPAVSVNGQAVTPAVASAVDMYYPITPRTDGTVVIVNNGDAMISVANLKVTSKLAGDKSASPFALLSAEALDIAADSNAAAGQDDGGNQGLQELIRELISNFVKALFNSISRLFGK